MFIIKCIKFKDQKYFHPFLCFTIGAPNYQKNMLKEFSQCLSHVAVSLYKKRKNLQRKLKLIFKWI